MKTNEKAVRRTLDAWDEKHLKRTLHGWGGIACPCCNKWRMSPRKSKPLENRHIRRKMRQIVLDATR